MNDVNETNDDFLSQDLAENFSAILDLNQIFNQTPPTHHEIIFDSGEQATLISFYSIILLLGFLFNAAIIWVIVGKIYLAKVVNQLNNPFTIFVLTNFSMK